MQQTHRRDLRGSDRGRYGIPQAVVRVDDQARPADQNSKAILIGALEVWNGCSDPEMARNCAGIFGTSHRATICDFVEVMAFVRACCPHLSAVAPLVRRYVRPAPRETPPTQTGLASQWPPRRKGGHNRREWKRGSPHSSVAFGGLPGHPYCQPLVC